MSRRQPEPCRLPPVATGVAVAEPKKLFGFQLPGSKRDAAVAVVCSEVCRDKFKASHPKAVARRISVAPVTGRCAECRGRLQ